MLCTRVLTPNEPCAGEGQGVDVCVSLRRGVKQVIATHQNVNAHDPWQRTSSKKPPNQHGAAKCQREKDKKRPRGLATRVRAAKQNENREQS